MPRRVKGKINTRNSTRPEVAARAVLELQDAAHREGRGGHHLADEASEAVLNVLLNSPTTDYYGRPRTYDFASGAISQLNALNAAVTHVVHAYEGAGTMTEIADRAEAAQLAAFIAAEHARRFVSFGGAPTNVMPLEKFEARVQKGMELFKNYEAAQTYQFEGGVHRYVTPNVWSGFVFKSKPGTEGFYARVCPKDANGAYNPERDESGDPRGPQILWNEEPRSAHHGTTVFATKDAARAAIGLHLVREDRWIRRHRDGDDGVGAPLPFLPGSSVVARMPNGIFREGKLVARLVGSRARVVFYGKRKFGQIKTAGDVALIDVFVVGAPDTEEPALPRGAALQARPTWAGAGPGGGGDAAPAARPTMPPIKTASPLPSKASSMTFVRPRLLPPAACTLARPRAPAPKPSVWDIMS